MSTTQFDNRPEYKEFLRNYYRQEVYEMASIYPDVRHIDVMYADLYQWNPDVAERILERPDMVFQSLDDALHRFDLPADVDISGAHVRVIGFPDDLVHSPAELDKTHTERYVAISGMLDRVTTKDELPVELAFTCARCGTDTIVPQSATLDLQEPTECVGCERAGPFHINHESSVFMDYCKVRVEHPPTSNSMSGSSITGFAIGDIVIDEGDYGLVEKAGESVTAYGIVRRRQKDNDKLFERVLELKALEYDREQDNVDIHAHKEEFVELSARDDAVDLFQSSLVPELYETAEWETALEWAVAYLFAAPRIDIDDGPTYRGDIHGAVFSDFGMGKSMFSEALLNYSPKAIRKSATGLSSDVGLTAAAVKDDFGEGQWTIKPGILVRASGGHVILDEIDKGPENLSKINDAIEGSQTVDIDKAGISATYNSRVGLLVLGNPKDGRFDKQLPVAEQIGVDPSTMSRFDGIITMKDTINYDVDAAVAGKSLKSLSEAQAIQFGDTEERETLDRPVSPEVGRAWVAYARENVYPRLPSEHIPTIQEWYATEVRTLNDLFTINEGEGADMPVPASPRVVMWVARFATAFARVHLRDVVATEDVERAMNLARRLVGQRWDGEKFGGVMDDGTRVKIMRQVENGSSYYASDVARLTKMPISKIERHLDRMVTNGEMMMDGEKYTLP